MNGPSQPDLFTPPENTPEANLARLRAALSQPGWHSRRQLCLALGLPEYELRHTLEMLGAEVVRGQLGFKLTRHLQNDDLPTALQAANQAISQGKKMIKYGVHLKTRLHQVIQ